VSFQFQNRAQAGRLLAAKLEAYAGRADVIVLGLPRGGVPVAREVARRLQAPLEVFLVRKLGAPGREELALGAIASGGFCFLNDSVVASLRVSRQVIDRIIAREQTELERRELAYRTRPATELRDRVVILVDDGLATGASMRVAVMAVRQRHPARVVVAAPVAAPETFQEFQGEVDEIVCVETPDNFRGVGQWYEDFEQTSDDEVRRLLAEADKLPSAALTESPSPLDADVQVPAGSVLLQGRLAIPDGASGVVIFAHGSGSSHHSPRNRFVADALRQAGLGTLLFDLLSPAEESMDRETARLRFDIALLAERLICSVDWLAGRTEAAKLPLGLFGASTGAAAALLAAARRPGLARAVVSRGGRPDLAGAALGDVSAPTLLIVGGDDTPTLELNRQAMRRLRCEKRLEIVPGATHLFEEPGTLGQVARLAAEWFQEKMNVER
jgi:putative phosphoribosyl transferase